MKLQAFQPRVLRGTLWCALGCITVWLNANFALGDAPATTRLWPSSNDQQTTPVRMLIGGTMLGKPGDPQSEYMRNGYGCDNYDAFKRVYAADGFNSYAFGVTNFTDYAGWVAWKTQVPGWRHMVECNYDLNLKTARQAGMSTCAEVLIAGMANKQIAAEHPEWRALDGAGKPAHYMGDQLSWNSPYWRQYLLPLYREYFTRYGPQTGSLLLWELRLDDFSPWDKAAYKKSGIADFNAWHREDQMLKWRELMKTIRATGWQGTVLGGGWGAFECEEYAYDGTVAHLNEWWNMIGPFNEGLIQVMMPELLIHANYGAGPRRRVDAHYVHRSLMYERSLFGDAMIPNFELFWQRAMTPDEVLRWVLENYSAGYPSYSVVSMEKLYLEKYAPEQETYRPVLRKVFQEVNKLPWFGRPVVNFQVLLSAELEKALGRQAPAGWIAKEQSWRPEFWRRGEACGMATFANGQTADTEYYVSCGPMTTQTLLTDVAPELMLNIKPADYEMKLVLLDETTGTCAAWINFRNGAPECDQKLGEIKLTGLGGERTITLPLPKIAFERAQDADPRTGKQIALRFAAGDGGWLRTPLSIDRIELWRAGKLMATVEPECENLPNWYTRELSSLFKAVDRAVCGGAIISNRLTERPDIERFGHAEQAVRFCLVPEGSKRPPDEGRPMHYLTVKPQETLARYAPQIIEQIRKDAVLKVGEKTPLVYANLTRRPDGREFLTVINHAAEPGHIALELPWPEVHPIISSEFIGKQVSQRFAGQQLSVKLDGYGALVLSNRN
jgi:hypothetical protein